MDRDGARLGVESSSFAVCDDNHDLVERVKMDEASFRTLRLNY